MIKVEIAKKSAIVLLAVLLVLLAVSFLPFGSGGDEKAAVNEKSVVFSQLAKLGSLPPAVDGKISPALKEEVKAAVYASAVAKGKPEADEARKVEFLVRSDRDIEGMIKDYGGEVLNVVKPADGSYVFFAVRADAEAVTGLASESEVARLSPRSVASVTLDESVPMIKADAFWNAGYKGNGVRVAVLDTGIDKTHPMLQGRVVAEKDFSNSGNVEDNYVHGTHVAGIIAGSTATGGLYSGVAPDALLLNAKVLDDSGNGLIDYILQGIEWALDPDSNPATDDGAKVISMSLGIRGPHEADFELVIKKALAKGVVVVAATGNCGPGCTDATCPKCSGFRGVTSPGSSPSVIAVGAVDKSKKVAYFSGGGVIEGVGIKPDFAAPGVAIKSSVPGGYAPASGTSMATPHVSGAVALMLSKSPALKPDEVRRVLEKTSVDLGDVGKDTSYGFGLVDMGRAFIYREGIEFAVEVEKLIISGNPQGIKVTVFDDVLIKSVSAVITRPDSSKATVSLSSSDGKVFTVPYADTALLGIYIVDATVEYGGSGGSAGTDGSSGSGTSTLTAMQTTSFKVTSLTGDFGNLEELNLSSTQFLSANFTANLTFANTAAIDLNFSALIQLYRLDGGVMDAVPSQEIRLPALPIAAGSRASAYADSRLNVAAGNYTMRIFTDYGAGSLVNETNVTVADDLPPLIAAVDYSSQLTGLSPQTFHVKLSEHGSIGSVAMSVNKSEVPVPVNYTITVPGGQGSGKELTATLFNGTFDAGNYKAVLGICDEHGNCAESLPLEFGVSACDGKNVLVVKTYDSESVFEPAVALEAGLCLAALNRSVTGTPPSDYLGRFDAVIWTTGTDIVNIDAADAEAIADYYSKDGRILVEGSDVAFRHGSDDLMSGVLHAELDNDIGFTVASTDGNLSGLNITLERPHPVVAGLGLLLPFNVTEDPFPDSVSPYNGSVVLAAWNGSGVEGAAVVAYESDDGRSKSLFLPFYVGAIGRQASEAVAKNAVRWLVGDGENDISVAELGHGFLVENEAALFSVSVASAAALESPPKMSVFLDGLQVNDGVLDLLTWADGAYTYSFELSLPIGEHSLRVVGSSDFSLPEASYVNNVKDFALRAYPKMSDLLITGFSYSYDEAAAAIRLTLNVSNLGGTAASSSVAAYLDGVEVANQAFGAGVGKTVEVQAAVNSGKGAYELRLAVDGDNSVAEFNESNNEFSETIYICSREKILVVDDNAAELFSTPEPSSADEFLAVLRNEGYCAEPWDRLERGMPDDNKLEEYPVVVWAAGDYFNGTLKEEDALAVKNYSGGLLLEGSDLGLDHADSPLFWEIVSAAFGGDMLLNESQNESLLLKSHAITANITGINVSKEKSPYPDAVEADAVNGKAVADWQGGMAAITAKTAAADERLPYKAAYYAFSVDGITNESVMGQLVVNTVRWLLEKPNTLPVINLSDGEGGFVPADIRITMKEGETKSFSVIASDPDNDTLTYTWLLNGTVVSTTQNFSFSPKFNESGEYNLTIVVSDGKDEARLEITMVVLDFNTPPVLEPVGNRTVAENSTLAFSLAASDNEGDALLFNATPLPEGASFDNGSAAFAWTPGFNQAGMHTVWFNVSDGRLSDAEEVNITVANVNRAPVIESVEGNLTVNETEAAVLIVKVADPDSDGITFTVNDTRFIQSGEDGNVFAWQTGYEDSGSYAVAVKVSDGSLAAEAVVTVTVIHVNRPPVIEMILMEPAGLVMGEGETKTFTAAVKDADKDALAAGWALDGTPVAEGVVFKYTPAYNDSGTHSIAFVVDDSDAATAAEMVLTVEDTLDCGTGQAMLCPLQLGVCSASFETCAAPGHWPGCAAGNYGASYTGEEAFCYGSSATGSATGNGNVNWQSNGCIGYCDDLDNDCDGVADEERVCNTPPVLEQVVMTGTENTLLEFGIEAKDLEGDRLTYSAASLPEGAYLSQDGEFAWAPTYEQAGMYNVEFVASDGLLIGKGTDTIIIGNVNRPPTAAIALSPPGESVEAGSTKLLQANASDPDKEDKVSYKWLLDGKEVAQGVGTRGGSYRYVAEWIYGGEKENTHEFTLVVSDGELTASAAQTIKVLSGIECPPGTFETEPCGTDTGACRQGTRQRVCGENFKWLEWSLCSGDVEPVPEDCTTSEDDDCDGETNEGCT